jgi:CRISPR-associated protein Cas6
MFWEEDRPEDKVTPSDDVVDLAFKIVCRSLPVDHAFDLFRAIEDELSWVKDEPQAGIHPIAIPEAGNGWMRPQGSDELLYLSRRTRLMIRLPRHRVEDGKRLVGKELDVAGNRLEIVDVDIRTLSDHATISSRYLVTDGSVDEEDFLKQAHQEMQDMGIRARKMLCGTERIIQTPEGEIHTRSLMVADLKREESLKLQQHGLGPHRHLGCGLFVPHKGIKEVISETEATS